MRTLLLLIICTLLIGGCASTKFGRASLAKKAQVELIGKTKKEHHPGKKQPVFFLSSKIICYKIKSRILQNGNGGIRQNNTFLARFI